MPARGTADPDPRALIVAPEPVDWLRPVIDALRTVMRVEVFAPWALPQLSRPVPSIGFIRRRDTTDVPRCSVGWPLRASFVGLELALRAHARGKAARTFAARFRMRALVDRLAAREVRRRAPALLLAPSLAARRTFAAAASHPTRCILIEDLPDLDHLVDGLDELAHAHPNASFLRNHRPRFADHVDQRAERLQAHAIAVRGAVALDRLQAKRCVALPTAPSTVTPTKRGSTVLLAGPAVARSGTLHLRALLDAMPELTVRIQPAERLEPAWLRNDARVQLDPAISFVDVGAVLSLASLESHPRAVARATHHAIPVVGTVASTGAIEGACHVDPKDVQSTVAAIRAALRGELPAPRPWNGTQSLVDCVRDPNWVRDQYSVAANVTA